MAKEKAPNRTYLIRCWQECNETATLDKWHFAVEEVLHERQQWGFGNLDELFKFLREDLGTDNIQPSRSIRDEHKPSVDKVD